MLAEVDTPYVPAQAQTMLKPLIARLMVNRTKSRQYPVVSPIRAKRTCSSPGSIPSTTTQRARTGT
jgi:hypothetical protein